MSRIGEIDLSKVRMEELKAMRDAGECVRECYRVLKRTNDSIVSEYLKRHIAVHADSHTPAAPIIDRKTNSQYWFHTDEVEQRPQETGHFHTFIQPKQIPRAGSPVATEPSKSSDDTGDKLCHIVAIAMDHTGFPARLFAPNKWVTGEAWHTADDVCHHLNNFTIDHAEPSYPVNVWITNMLVLFRPQIRRLLTARDSIIAERRRRRPEEDALEDRGLAVTVDQTIDVVRQLNAIREALQVRTATSRRTARIVDAANTAMRAEAMPALSIPTAAHEPAQSIPYAAHEPARSVPRAAHEPAQSIPPAAHEPAQSVPRAAHEPAQSIPPAAQELAQLTEAALETQIRALQNAVLTAKSTARAFEEEVGKTRRQAWEREKLHTAEIAGLRERHESDVVELLIEAKKRLKGEFQKKLAGARAEWQRETAARLDAVRKETRETVSSARETTFVELRAQWRQESKNILAEAIRTRKIEEIKRLTTAKAKWESARQTALAHRDLTWQIAFDHRVEEALESWKADEETRFEQAKAGWYAERRFRAAKRRQFRLWARRIARGVLIAIIIGGGIVYYPKAKSVITEKWESIVVTNWNAMEAWIADSIRVPDPPAQIENSSPDIKVTAPPEPDIPQSYIQPGAANLRAKPSPTANVIGILRQGTRVQRLGQRGRWVRVGVPGASGKTGWIHASLLADQPAR